MTTPSDAPKPGHTDVSASPVSSTSSAPTPSHDPPTPTSAARKALQGKHYDAYATDGDERLRHTPDSTSKPKVKEFKTKPSTNVDSLTCIFDPTKSLGLYSWCPNEEGAPPTRDFDHYPEKLQEDTPSHSLTMTIATNKKRKGVGIIDGGFSYFQAESEAQRQADRLERQAERAERERVREAQRQADRLERAERERVREAQRQVDRLERVERERVREAQWQADRLERQAKRAERERVRVEEETYSINEVVKVLMKMEELGVIRMKFIRQVIEILCENLGCRKAFLDASTVEEKHVLLQMMGGHDSD